MGSQECACGHSLLSHSSDGECSECSCYHYEHPRDEITLDDSQLVALDLMNSARFGIVTGGPGTGKTTILREALRLLAEYDARAILCAPTGKAAKRMSEATGHKATTVHRALGYYVDDAGQPAWRFHALNPLQCDIVFVDEASMLDVYLCARLLAAVNPAETRLILIGDANQLPSVGPGSILQDLVGMPNAVPCAVLTHVHRSAAKSWICQSAPVLLAGKEIDLAPRDDFRFVRADAASEIAGKVGAILDKRPDAQVLVPQKTGAAGTDAINLAMQERLNPLRPAERVWFPKSANPLRPRDRVIHVRNNYDLGVFNGEVGSIVSVEESRLLVQYPDLETPVVYSKSDAFDLRLAYALTIHKSQGSEWPWVVVVAHSTHSYMLTRRLVYTAITRGKEGVILVGNEKGIAHATANNKDEKRNTALEARITQTLAAPA